LGIKSGSALCAFDGNEVTDILDYQYYNAQESFVMTVSDGGELTDYEIDKDADEDLGLTVEDGLQPVRVCGNRCVFCFVDQLPEGMRESLYVKDDDWRLSVISGNYVTLTNLTARDRSRIIRYRISPLYVSVHASDPAVRGRLLGKKNSDILPILRELAAHGIKIHAQIVLVPDINDGAELEKTITEIKPYTQSLAVVPVGLTAYANPAIRNVDKECARRTVALCRKLAEKYRGRGGAGYVYCADEMYVIAGLPVPPPADYDGFPQIENGVGLMAEFEEALRAALCDGEFEPVITEAVIVTGSAARAFMEQMAGLICARFPQVRLSVAEIVNKTFGASVTVAGLLAGRDIAAQAPRGGVIILPRVMLREFTDVFLDDMSVAELAEILRAEIIVAETTGEGLLEALTTRN
ncbi:MAG: DUF512 domain-containing protein, partial [Clostridiales bacterium]|nr:DUF512 domain-containing protein [Clostridiales bacterium]